jgi:hypothetical protein
MGKSIVENGVGTGRKKNREKCKHVDRIFRPTGAVPPFLISLIKISNRWVDRCVALQFGDDLGACTN